MVRYQVVVAPEMATPAGVLLSIVITCVPTSAASDVFTVNTLAEVEKVAITAVESTAGIVASYVSAHVVGTVVNSEKAKVFVDSPIL